MKKFLTYCFVFFFLFTGFADIKSNSGNIGFDVDNDSNIDVILNADGLAIGTSTVGANLHVQGNMVVESGNFSIGATGSIDSSLEITGTIGFGIENVSGNKALSGNSVVLADSSQGNIALYLPYSGNVLGRIYTIKKMTSSNNIEVFGGGLIDNSEGYLMTSSSSGYPFMKFISSGNHWSILSQSSDGVSSDRLIASENLVAYWKLDETNGTNASDSSVNGNDGTLTNGISFSGCTVLGKVGNALSFDGVDDFINVTDDNAFDIGTSDFTITFWVKRERNGVLDGILDHEDGSNAGYQLQFQTSNVPRLRIDDGPDDVLIDPATTIADTNWHFFAYVADKSSATGGKVYIDNHLDANTYDITSIGDITSTQDLYLGRTNNTYFDGLIDDIRIYNKVLSSEEIESLFRLGQ